MQKFLPLLTFHLGPSEKSRGTDLLTTAAEKCETIIVIGQPQPAQFKRFPLLRCWKAIKRQCWFWMQHILPFSCCSCCVLSASEQPFFAVGLPSKSSTLSINTQIQMRSGAVPHTIIAFARYLVRPLKKNAEHWRRAASLSVTVLFVGGKTQTFHHEGFGSCAPCQMFLKWLSAPTLRQPEK